MFTKDEIEKMNPELTWGCCMRNPGPCDICGGQDSLMYGIFTKGMELERPLAVVCNSHNWMVSLAKFWNSLPVEERMCRFNERVIMQ